MNEIAIGSYILQPGRQLRLGDERVELGPRALDILSELARRRGEIVKKDELLAAVWPDAIVGENSLQVHMTALRRALGDDAELIETIRGIGYQLQGPQPNAEAATNAGSSALNLPLFRFSDASSKDDRSTHSLIVLPFKNRGPTPDQDYFCDGLVEDIIMSVSQIPELMVISRGTAFEVRQSSASPDEIARVIGARHVLSGSVRRVGNRARVATLLQEAASGRALWSRTYDRDIEDVFSVQDELARDIVTALDVNLVGGENALVTRTTYTSVEAAQELYRGMFEYYKYDQAANIAAGQHFERFIELEPQSPLGYAWLSNVWLGRMLVQWAAPQEAMPNMRENASRALEIDPDNAAALTSNCYFHVMAGELEKALGFGRRAVKCAPNSDEAFLAKGWAEMFLGQTEDAILSLERAIRLSPVPPSIRLGVMGTVYRNAGRYEDSISTFQQLLERYPDFLYAYTGLAASYAMDGQMDLARAMVTEILKRDPAYTIERFRNPDLYASPEVMERCAIALEAAGLAKESRD